jgi:hypothetical protein
MLGVVWVYVPVAAGGQAGGSIGRRLVELRVGHPGDGALAVDDAVADERSQLTMKATCCCKPWMASMIMMWPKQTRSPEVADCCSRYCGGG